MKENKDLEEHRERQKEQGFVGVNAIVIHLISLFSRATPRSKKRKNNFRVGFLRLSCLILLLTSFECFFFYIIKSMLDNRSEALISIHGNNCFDCKGGIIFKCDPNCPKIIITQTK